MSTCEKKFGAEIINQKHELTFEHLQGSNPDFIFFLHWSYIIPPNIFENFNCIVFHMTDLPYGRGGSPLQNLVARGHKETMISALKVTSGIDTGPIFLKRPLSLDGTAAEIFLRSGRIMLEMIEEIISGKIQPIEQHGDIVIFQRRTPAQSNVKDVLNTRQMYDHIRMLDAPGYPKAFLETEHLRFEFSGAELADGDLTANVRITKK
jgi:methionyl-tRNA formyltransferase